MTFPDGIKAVKRATAEFFEDLWFDWTRNVQTAGEVSLRNAGVEPALAGDSEAYQPARPTHIRRALRHLAVHDMSDYTYIDLGSGKGRTLFIAAEWPFRDIIGVELTPVLQAQACANIQNFRQRKNGCERLQSVRMNAVDFVFPETKLVLYMFNPFGLATVRQVLSNLATSLQRHPRHAIVVLLWPQWEAEVATMNGMQLCHATHEYRIYEAYAAQSENRQG